MGVDSFIISIGTGASFCLASVNFFLMSLSTGASFCLATVIFLELEVLGAFLGGSFSSVVAFLVFESFFLVLRVLDLSSLLDDR